MENRNAVTPLGLRTKKKQCENYVRGKMSNDGWLIAFLLAAKLLCNAAVKEDRLIAFFLMNNVRQILNTVNYHFFPIMVFLPDVYGLAKEHRLSSLYLLYDNTTNFSCGHVTL